MADSGWRIDLAVPAFALEVFEAALENLGGVLVLGARPEDGQVPLQLYLTARPEPPAVAAALATAALAAGIEVPEHRTRRLADRDWVAESQRRLPPIRAGRFYVYGAHVAGPPPRGSIPLLIDANVAFGTGRHESTRGCLLALQCLARSGFAPRRSLDMGCGSGVLALAMAKLWPRPVLAVDNDPQAAAVARRNARINRTARLVRTLVSDGYRHRKIAAAGPFDLIAANILAEPLAEMAEALHRHLAPGGRAVLSGLLAHQEKLVLNTHLAQGLRLQRRIQLGSWTTLVLERSGKRRP